MQGLVYTFEDLKELSTLLESSGEDQDLALPCRYGVCEGEWLLATFSAGEESTCVPGRICDRGQGLRLTFEARDWERLCEFASGGARPSIPPPCDATPVGAVTAPAGSSALLVDADAGVSSIVRAMLEACGVATDTVHGAEDALDLLRRRRFDLIVVEPTLNGMSGLELCERLRADSELCATPVLVLASHTGDRDLRELKRCGASDFVGKPFRAHELRARAIGLIQQGRAGAPSARRA